MEPPAQKEPSELFRYFREIEARTIQFQVGIATWVIGTLLAINGGALVALMSALDNRPELVGSGWPFVAGIVSAVVCGLCVWFNLACVGEAVTDRLDWQNLHIEDPESADLWDKRAVRFGWASLVAIALSLTAFTYGAVGVERALGQASKTEAAKSASPPPAHPKSER